MSPTSIIDSHIHMWGEEAANQETHAWMVPIPGVTWKAHLVPDYLRGAGQNESIKGVVYVETDRRYDQPTSDVSTWAKGPLDEISFLRSIIDGHYGQRDGDLLLGVVPWAPMDQPMVVLKSYLELAETRAGEKAWKRVKGFRFLLQALDRHEFETLVFSEHFIQNLRLLGSRGFSFDVGVDQRSGGTWQLDSIAKVMAETHKGVPKNEQTTFIINHLCKPDFSDTGLGFEHWRSAITAMSNVSGTYMKLSGGFSELPSHGKSAKEIADHMLPWVQHVFQAFGPDRIIFGSDWPVCNLGGPKAEASWTSWAEVVETLLDDETLGLDDSERRRIWSTTIAGVYGL